MEVKKIVEGMTAPEVAAVIEANFNEVDRKKSDKTDVEKGLSDLLDEVNGKIVQETGDSETLVMSQKAVTDALEGISNYGLENEGKVLAVGYDGRGVPTVGITETKFSDNRFNPDGRKFQLDIKESSKEFIYEDGYNRSVVIALPITSVKGECVMAKLFVPYTSLGILTINLIEADIIPKEGLNYDNIGVFSTARNGCYIQGCLGEKNVYLYVKFNSIYEMENNLSNVIDNLYVRVSSSISWPESYVPFSVQYLPNFYNKDESYDKKEVDNIVYSKVSKIMDTSEKNKALTVGVDGSVMPTVVIADNEVISDNIFDYKTAKKLPLVNYELTRQFVVSQTCVLVALNIDVVPSDRLVAKFFLERQYNEYGIVQVTFVTSRDKAAEGVPYVNIGYANLGGRSGGYIDSISEDGLLVYLKVEFDSAANCSNYADYVLSRIVVIKGKTISWPESYSDYIVDYRPIFYNKKEVEGLVGEKLNKNQGVGNKGKYMKVDGDGNIVYSELDSSGVDLSDCIKKKVFTTLFLGKDVLDGITGTGNGWIETDGVYKHTSGNTDPLVFELDTEPNVPYVVCLYTGISNFVEHDVNVSVGNGELCDIYKGITGPYYIGVISDGGMLKITPGSNYNSTVYNVQLRKIVPENMSDIEVTLQDYNVNSNTSDDNISGFWNVCVAGSNSLVRNQNGSRNVSIGVNSLTEMRSGERNVAIGTFALNQLRWGIRNIAIGSDALYRCAYAKHNVAIGKAAAGFTHADPSAHKYERNTAIGDNALGANATHYMDNTAIGKDAASGDISGNKERNVSVGVEAGYYNGLDNVAIGYRADRYSRGSNNVYIGANTGDITETGNNNVIIGKEAKIYSGTGTSSNRAQHDNTIVIGFRAKANKSNQVVIGNKNQTEFIVLGNKKLNFNSDGTVTWEEVSDL